MNRETREFIKKFVFVVIGITVLCFLFGVVMCLIAKEPLDAKLLKSAILAFWLFGAPCVMSLFVELLVQGEEAKEHHAIGIAAVAYYGGFILSKALLWAIPIVAGHSELICVVLIGGLIIHSYNSRYYKAKDAESVYERASTDFDKRITKLKLMNPFTGEFCNSISDLETYANKISEVQQKMQED